MEVAGGIYRLTHGIANFYLIEEEGKLLLVDAGTPKDWEIFTSAVAGLGRRLDDLDAILLTHAHADHTGFAEQARTASHAPVWIHEDDERAVVTGEAGAPDGHIRTHLFKPQLYRTMMSLARQGAAKIIPVEEVSTFEDGEVLDLPGKPRVVHAPGHTEGSSALLLEGRRALFAGDAMATWNPLTGRSGPQIMPAAMNHDSERAMQSLRALEKIDADVVLPGHGEPWTGGLAEAVQLARDAGPT
jgi:glyoxylase-like metal-dependent hydrolase (beta-lactamase superfamily II)